MFSTILALSASLLLTDTASAAVADMSVQSAGGVLTVTGTSEAEAIRVMTVTTTTLLVWATDDTGSSRTWQVSSKSVTSVSISAGGGDDEVYLLGDNRDSSIDSRTYGPVQLDDVVGSVLVRFWPPSRYGKVDWS